MQDDLESVLGALTEKMISDMYFDKAFIGANRYIPDGHLHLMTEAREKVIVKTIPRWSMCSWIHLRRISMRFPRCLIWGGDSDYRGGR